MKQLLAIAIILLSGCTTIHFDRDNTIYLDAVKVEKWHHNMVAEIIEVSDPVRLDQECGDKQWSSIQTEETFFDGLIKIIINQVAPIWAPKTVTISCI